RLTTAARASGPSWLAAPPRASEVCKGWRPCTRPPQRWQWPTWTSNRRRIGRRGIAAGEPPGRGVRRTWADPRAGDPFYPPGEAMARRRLWDPLNKYLDLAGLQIPLRRVRDPSPNRSPAWVAAGRVYRRYAKDAPDADSRGRKFPPASRPQPDNG